jgi:hypothetical protein
MSNIKEFLSQVTDEDVAFNSKIEHLYNHTFSDGRFFQVVFSNDEETHIKLASRTLLKVVYLKDKDDIEGLQIIKVVSEKETEKVKLSKFNLQQLRCFLAFINSIDLKGVSERRINLASNSLDTLDNETRKKIETLLSSSEGGEIICDLLKKGLINNKDLVNTGYRRQQLQKFYKLLFEQGLSDYKHEIGKATTKDETAWQHFFMSNQWIFGYGLDYKFQGVLQKEFHASDTTAAGKEGVIADYLLGDKRFTTFVELKLPNTKLFDLTKNRSRTWSLSVSLLDAYSQILEHKASGQIKVETAKNLLDESNNEILQHSYDSKTILIIGNWNQICDDAKGERIFKEKTFELFRRDSRNIDIITYDELYERAKFILGE